MKFRVHLGWKENYLFDSTDEAVRFAITAKVKREEQQPNDIRIELLSEADLESEWLEKEAAND